MVLYLQCNEKYSEVAKSDLIQQLLLYSILSDIKKQSDLQENHGVQPNTKFGLQHFNYSNFAMLQNVYNHLSETDYYGIVVMPSLTLNFFIVIMIVLIFDHRVTLNSIQMEVA